MEISLRIRAALLVALSVLGALLLSRVTIAVHAANPALRSVSTNATNDVNFTASAPAGETAGDVLIAALQLNGTGTITAPSGWALIGTTRSGSDNTYSYVKVAGSAEPAFYTWSSTVSSNGSIAILAYTGIDITAPVNAWAGGSGSGSAVAPAVTTTATTVSLILATWDGGALLLLTPTTPQGYTERWFLHSYEWTYGADNLTPVAAGTQPAQTVSTMLGGVWTAQQIALTVAGATPTPTPTPTGPQLRNVSSSATNSYTFTVAAPSGETAGDVLIAALQLNGTGTITAPSGWTLIGATSYGADNTSSYVKVAGSSEPSSYTWSSTAYSNGSISILDYIGINSAAPVNAWAGDSGSGSTAVAPAVTTTATTVSVVLVTWDGGASSLTVTTPAGFTQRWLLNSYEWTYGADNLSPVTGNQPPVSVAASASAIYTVQQIALSVS